MKNLFKQEINDDNYMGNIFGWKISLIGLVVMVALVALIFYGHRTGKIDIRTGEAVPKTEKPAQN